MDPQYHLPFRPSDTRTSSAWLPQPQSPYAIVSPQQHPHIQSHHHHQHHQQQHPQQPSSQEQQSLGQIQHHGPFYYGHYHGNSLPVVLPYSSQQALSYEPQPPPLIPVQGLMSPPRSKTLPSLPLPSHILPSQNANPGPCLACGKTICSLSSHRHFSKHILMRSRNRGVSSSQTSTPRVAQSSLVRSSHIDKPTTEPSHLVLDAQREHLLALWSKEWAQTRRGPERHLFPDKFIDRVLPAARAHPPLFQALLAYSGTMWAVANNIIGDIALSQQAFAVELLSQACPTETEASTDEGMLAATLLLLVYMTQGNGFEVSKHVSGLVHLARLRGGPHYLGLSGLVAETLIHADHMQAIFFNHQPVWQLPLPPLEMGLPARLGHGFQTATSRHEIDLPLSLAAGSVCKVADIFEAAAGGRQLPTKIRNAFNYLSTISEYQLARCNAAYNQTADADECVCLSLILFNHVVLRNDGAITPSILQVEHRFWHALDSAEAKGSAMNMLPSMYMWMVINGLTVSIRAECQYRNHAIGKLRTARINAGIQTWEQLRQNVLDDFVWLPEAQEETFRRVWAEVEGPKGSMPTPIIQDQNRPVLPLAG